MDQLEINRLRLLDFEKEYLSLPDWAKDEKYEYVIPEYEFFKINHFLSKKSEYRLLCKLKEMGNYLKFKNLG